MQSTATAVSIMPSTSAKSFRASKKRTLEGECFPWWHLVNQGIRAGTVRWAIDGTHLQLFCELYLQRVRYLVLSSFLILAPAVSKSWIKTDPLWPRDSFFCTPCTTVNTFCLHTDNAFVSDTNTIIRLCSPARLALGLDDTLSFKMPDFTPWVVSLLKSWGYWPFSLIPEFHFQYYRIKIRRW